MAGIYLVSVVRRTAALFLCVGLFQTSVLGGAHLWRIHEVFSNADGSVQFVELRECCGAENERFIEDVDFTSDATGGVFTFPGHLTESTSNKYMLLATAGFAALPGAPEPDYVLEDGFVGIGGDTLWYGPARNYDKFVFEDGDLPTDGLNSIQLTGFVSDVFTTAVNSPTNFSGDTGVIDVRESASTPYRRGDCDDDGERVMTDAVFLLRVLFLAPEPLVCADACDANDDGVLNVSDGVKMLLSLFFDGLPLPAPMSCGADPTVDPLPCGSFSTCS